MTDASHDRPAILHSLFDLADGVAKEDFKQALEAFFEHLKAKGFAKELAHHAAQARSGIRREAA